MTEKPTRCPQCRRMILPSRMADHNIIARIEHEVSRIERMGFEQAYALLCDREAVSYG